MKTMKNLFMVLTLVSVVCLISCKDDDPVGPCNSFNFGAEIEAELTAYNNASMAYFTNQTPANCNAFKAAGIAYVNELEDLEECAILGGQNEQQYQQSIDAARASFEAIVC